MTSIGETALPAVSFAELAAVLRHAADEQAAVVSNCEQLVARLEAGVSADLSRDTRLAGMRFSLAALQQRAQRLGALTIIFEQLIPLEREVRALHAEMRSRTERQAP